MRSTKNTRAVVVGIFVFLGVAIFVLTVLTLGGQQKTFAKSVTVKAIFDDINGLQKGNNIWFSGVKIGTIKKISFYGTSQVEVELDIEEDAAKYIRKNAIARISQEGMIGSRIVVIDAVAGNAPPVEEGNLLAVTKTVNPEEMMKTFQANNLNLLSITNDFKLLSSDIAAGKGSVGKLLKDETLFTEVQTTMNMLKRSANNAQLLSNDLAAYTARLDNKGTLANDLVTDTTIFRTLRTTIAKMEEASNNANQVVNNLNVTTTDLSKSLKNPNAPAGMLLNDEKTATDIKLILRTLQSATIKLDEDLEAIQHNFLLRGFFKKKAKREAEEKAKLQGE